MVTSPVTRLSPLSRVHRRKCRIKFRKRSRTPFRSHRPAHYFSGLFCCRNFRVTARSPTKTCAAGIRRAMQKIIFEASHPTLRFSLNPCPFPLVLPAVPLNPSLDVHRGRSPNSLLATLFSLLGPLLLLLNSPKGLLFRYAYC
jgi:hypothetical protein